MTEFKSIRELAEYIDNFARFIDFWEYKQGAVDTLERSIGNHDDELIISLIAWVDSYCLEEGDEGYIDSVTIVNALKGILAA